MATRTEKSKRTKLQAAFQKLPILDGKAGLAQTFISALSEVSVEGSGVISENFQRNPRKTPGQLRGLRDMAGAG